MAEKDDQHWLDALAGRITNGADGADPATLKEAQAVRRAVLATKPEQDAQDFDVESGAQKLLFRLRREGPAGAEKKKSWQLYGAYALAASLVLAVGMVVLQPPPVEDAPVYRGGGAQTISAPDTEKLAGTITAELEALGVKAKVTRFGATHTITADWPAKPDAKHAAFLKRHGLKQPASGALTIELQSAARTK
jgi:hypothetical protein